MSTPITRPPTTRPRPVIIRLLPPGRPTRTKSSLVGLDAPGSPRISGVSTLSPGVSPPDTSPVVSPTPSTTLWTERRRERGRCLDLGGSSTDSLGNLRRPKVPAECDRRDILSSGTPNRDYHKWYPMGYVRVTKVRVGGSDTSSGHRPVGVKHRSPPSVTKTSVLDRTPTGGSGTRGSSRGTERPRPVGGGRSR